MFDEVPEGTALQPWERPETEQTGVGCSEGFVPTREAREDQRAEGEQGREVSGGHGDPEFRAEHCLWSWPLKPQSPELPTGLIKAETQQQDPRSSVARQTEVILITDRKTKV